ncbi:PDR/VanB family oxidoreductase [Pseudomonas sp. FP2300]|uniref:PDR/VanB family oxidoreductase n=1 Tax=Pseudomonas sp. FP2300 TaxID=2954090 RepID=UPI002735D545|nr:PDR/VanB family oxidoreductase [Pseudomonas sp. FP2300]WLH65169.1 PDR/VanB family oxidoreductase [Pseudomonas sp. FP2300]
MSSEFLDLKVASIVAEAKDIIVIELVDPQGQSLPPFEPGAHLELHLPNGLVRHYSLCGDSQDRKHYHVGIGLARESRGGSRFLHGSIAVGSVLRSRPPRNNFPLSDSASHYVFIAGGIGITPILSMIRWCESNNKKWELYYLVRNRQRAAFYETLQSLPGKNVHNHFDDEAGRHFDIQSCISSLESNSHLYCCGPAPLMSGVEASAAQRPDISAHFEWFNAQEIDSSEDKGFRLIARSSGLELDVPADRSILDVLEANGVNVPFACREGICGACETDVVCGDPEHRDLVLTNEEKLSGKRMMICVSRSRTPTLELNV